MVQLVVLAVLMNRLQAYYNCNQIAHRECDQRYEL
jgi:hypothetical protein